MAFSNIYDVTFPADTQLANLLGSDLRNLALNVQQRMAAISGLAANLPAVGSDAQPANWTGLLYFATDTQQIFQWSGTAWVDVSTSILPPRTIYKNTASTTHTGDTTLDTIYTIPVSAGLLGTNGILRVTIYIYISSQNASIGTVITLNFGGTNISTNTISAGYILNHVNGNIANQNSASAQISDFGYDFITGSTSYRGLSRVSSTINTANAQNLLIQVQNGESSDSQTFDQVVVELL